MLRSILIPCVLALGILGAGSRQTTLPKGVQKVEFRPDNTGSISWKMSGFWWIEDDEQDATQQQKMAKLSLQRKERLTILGVDVKTSSTVEVVRDEGTEHKLELSGHIPDINNFIERTWKHAHDPANASLTRYQYSPAEEMRVLALLGSMNTARFEPGLDGMVNQLQYAFYRTGDPSVGRLQIIPPLAQLMSRCKITGNPLHRMAALAAEKQQDVVRELEGSRRFLNDNLSWSIHVGVPGAIVALDGCTKSGDGKTVTWSVVRDDLCLETMKAMLARKDGVWVDFKIPEGCKIAFKDPPMPEAKPEAKKEEPAKAK